MKEKKVTIIIPFVSLNDYVLECIEGCLAQNYPNFELVLLPDAAITLPLKYSRKKVKTVVTNTPRIAKKRNIGINKFPKTELYAFIDSDAYPHPNWLKNAVQAFFLSKTIWAVGGPNITPPEEPIRRKAVGNALKSFLLSGIGNFRKKITKSRYCQDLPTCNLLIKKAVIRKLKGFDENLITGEDMDLCMKIIEQKGKIRYHNKVIVYHHNRPLFVPFILQRITYGFSVFKVLKRKLSLTNLTLLAPFLLLSFFFFGFILSIFDKTIRNIWLAAMALYLIILLIETKRCSPKISEMPLTFTALLFGNLSPGVGTVLAFLGINVNIKKIYKNYCRQA